MPYRCDRVHERLDPPVRPSPRTSPGGHVRSLRSFLAAALALFLVAWMTVTPTHRITASLSHASVHKIAASVDSGRVLTVETGSIVLTGQSNPLPTEPAPRGGTPEGAEPDLARRSLRLQIDVRVTINSRLLVPSASPTTATKAVRAAAAANSARPQPSTVPARPETVTVQTDPREIPVLIVHGTFSNTTEVEP